MKIEILLDKSDADDPLSIDPVGTIKLSDGENYIIENYVFVDSWLRALIEGSIKLLASERVEIDLVEERDPLILERQNDKIIIFFRDKFVYANSTEEIEKAANAAFAML